MATNNATNEPTAAVGKIWQGQGVGTTSAFSTATYPSVSAGSGKILYDNGTNFVTSVPTFPTSASSTSRKIVVSDGTNWVASTETWAVPGTNGNILTSNGTNWTSAAAPGGGMLSVSGVLTNAQIKALHGTPIQIIAAPGSGKAIVITMVVMTMNYGGSNVFTAGASQTVALYYGTTTIINTAMSNAMIVASATQIKDQTGNANTTVFSSWDNQLVNLYNPIATEISGNAANNNTMSYYVQYFILTP